LGDSTYIHGNMRKLLCSYLTQAKNVTCFPFFFYKIGEQEGGTGPGGQGGVLVPVGREEVVEKGCRRVNMVQILCTHVCK
jgi:hypothetical protein